MEVAQQQDDKPQTIVSKFSISSGNNHVAIIADVARSLGYRNKASWGNERGGSR